MTSQEILKKYLDFYTQRNHKLIPNVSLVPEGDSTLLFVNSGMFPLVPYLSGEKHPLGTRLINVQRSVRFEDIDDIGDNRHTLAFHMIGNWSLSDYFKKEQLPWVYQFLVEELKLDPNRLYATVFAGDENAPKDEESIALLKDIFKKYGIDAKEGERIYACGKKSNWWQRGDAVGELGGPDSEIFYYTNLREPVGTKTPETHEDDFLEIGNSVFMQYKRTETGWQELPQKNVDFGGGLERIAMVVQQKEDIFETDNFWPIIEKIQKITGKDYYESDDTKKYMRVIADHLRASVLLCMDGVTPSNKDQGYALRRLMRKMFRASKHLGFEKDSISSLVGVVDEILGWQYPQLAENIPNTISVLQDEEEKFERVLKAGGKEANKIIDSKNSSEISILDWATVAFDLYQSYGYPLEVFYEDLKEKKVLLSYTALAKEFDAIFTKHKDQSRIGAEQKFKGGLADNSETVVKYHTATHLLQKALREVLGEHVAQLGSNITGERLRFDFPNENRLTDIEIKKVEDIINKTVETGLPVNYVMLPKEDAIKSGALFMKNESYPDQVKVYYIGDSLETAVSKEFCGGPHVKNTSEIGALALYKQESIGKGKQRVYARVVH